MSELCHVCDLFRTALFGPTNTEDHLDDGLGNDLPRPMADAPATMGVRPTRNRQGASQTATSSSKPGSQQQLAGGNGTTATPSIASEAAAPRAAAAAAAADAAAAPAPTVSASTPATAAPAAAAAVTEPSAAPAPAPAAAAAAVSKPVPKTKFSKRAARGLKAAPAYMSFDDVDVEADDDSDGELFVEDSRDNRGSGASRSPVSVAAQAASSKSASAYTVNAPSVYRAPSLAPPAAAAPAAPALSDAPTGGPHDQEEYSAMAAGRGEDDGSSGVPVAAVSAKENMSSHQAIAGDSSAEILSSGSGLRGGLAGGLRLGGEHRVMSIPRDGSMLESARPHGQSESFHGYKGYPGYEPDTPVAQQLTQPGRAHATDALTINPGADVSDPRTKHAGAAGPTPSSVRFTPREMEVSSEIGSTMTPVQREEQQHYQQQQYQQEQALGMDIDGRDDYVEEQQQHQLQSRQQRRQHRQHQQPVISPSGTTSMEMATGLRPPEPRSRAAQVEQHDVDVGDGRHSNTNTGLSSRGGTGGVPMSSTGGGGGMQYGSEAGGENNSSYGGGGGHVVPSPSHSQANSMSSSYRNIQQLRSEDGMGSVLGTLAGTEDSTNEDLQWKRSALKKFHKVMVKGEGLRVVKHNRSGGSQMRIIRYDPEIKALVWNSKRYMKKAGSANVPIVGIKRVGREGNTVSVTAAGRGTIGFEPQRIRDAKILAEALRALVDKEERSAMWRG
ncbi:unnamed protein product [Ectocarpus sp. 4 AP-2014]